MRVNFETYHKSLILNLEFVALRGLVTMLAMLLTDSGRRSGV